jgi:hypothetical protein
VTKNQAHMLKTLTKVGPLCPLQMQEWFGSYWLYTAGVLWRGGWLSYKKDRLLGGLYDARARGNRCRGCKNDAL